MIVSMQLECSKGKQDLCCHVKHAVIMYAKTSNLEGLGTSGRQLSGHIVISTYSTKVAATAIAFHCETKLAIKVVPKQQVMVDQNESATIQMSMKGHDGVRVRRQAALMPR